ncbi:MAG: ABC transporter permease [Rhodothermales bacterium]|nr:ABC transporter permease [Rhodothermales bacterium]MDG2016497.1 ABC transporter permease [Rhodothermales bacterium]HAY35659.1 ABC transporter permease [Bacteroidota bacterium]
MPRNKTFVVAKNEFMKRVKTRWFVFTTLLGPMVLIGFMTVIGFVTASAIEGGESTIAVLDQTGRMELDDSDSFTFVATVDREEDLRNKVLNDEYSGYLVLPEGLIEGTSGARYYSSEGGGISSFNWDLERTIRDVVRLERLEDQNVSREVFDIIDAGINLETIKISDEGEEEGSTAAYAIVGAIMGFLIYITMLIYGSVVMQGVIQEKMNRVVEIIISSVRPFQLLMGKVLGIGAMGLVQMSFWAGLIAAGTFFSGTLVSMIVDPANLNLPETASQEEILAATNFNIPDLGPEVFIWFVLFFLGGYLLYATLFAGVGSAVEQQQDAQSLMLPLMMPIIVSIVFLQAVIEAPNSTLSVALSMFPFTAPIPMVVRVAMIDVPFWQVGLSFALLMASFVGAVWVSSRIYRIGILSYGKKPSLKEMIKWMRYA